MEHSPITNPDYTVTDRHGESSVISSVSSSSSSEEEDRALFEKFLKFIPEYVANNWQVLLQGEDPDVKDGKFLFFLNVNLERYKTRLNDAETACKTALNDGGTYEKEEIESIRRRSYSRLFFSEEARITYNMLKELFAAMKAKQEKTEQGGTKKKGSVLRYWGAKKDKSEGVHSSKIRTAWTKFLTQIYFKLFDSFFKNSVMLVYREIPFYRANSHKRIRAYFAILKTLSESIVSEIFAGVTFVQYNQPREYDDALTFIGSLPKDEYLSFAQFQKVFDAETKEGTEKGFTTYSIEALEAEIKQLHDNNFSNICKRNKLLGDLSRRKRSSSDDSTVTKRARNTTTDNTPLYDNKENGETNNNTSSSNNNSTSSSSTIGSSTNLNKEPLTYEAVLNLCSQMREIFDKSPLKPIEVIEMMEGKRPLATSNWSIFSRIKKLCATLNTTESTVIEILKEEFVGKEEVI